MTTRREFLKNTGAIVLGSLAVPAFAYSFSKISNPGIQLYTFRKEMLADAIGTLKLIASLGIKQIETARSTKGHYYGLGPAEMKKVCEDLGMTLRSGHVHLDDQWARTMQEAAEAGQEYLICSSLPSSGQTVDNYKKVADQFNKAGEQCRNLNMKFGYHNHEYEFESENGQVLFDVLLKETDSRLVHMELDLGWVIVGGKNPVDYFRNFPGRFPLWHLKDMDMVKKHSTEFGKGGLDIPLMFKQADQSGLRYYFIEQEEYASNPLESMRENLRYLNKLN